MSASSFHRQERPVQLGVYWLDADSPICYHAYSTFSRTVNMQDKPIIATTFHGLTVLLVSSYISLALMCELTENACLVLFWTDIVNSEIFNEGANTYGTLYYLN